MPAIPAMAHPRRQIAEVLVASLTSTEALRKTFELVATRGPAQHDLDPLFAQLDVDPPGAVDAVRDLPNMPPGEEPELVRRDLASATVVPGGSESALQDFAPNLRSCK